MFGLAGTMSVFGLADTMSVFGLAGTMSVCVRVCSSFNTTLFLEAYMQNTS